MMGSNDSLQNNNNNNNGAGNTIIITNTNPFPGGSRGPTRSTVSGQSVSTSGSAGSPSTRSDSTVLRLNRLHIHADDDAASQLASGKKKKRAQRAIGGDKGGRGLRQFSMKVCEKVESKGRTTYNEVADELVAEFSDPGDGDQAPDQKQYDEKNIRRRVYDAINVLMALDIISKDKKEIQWRGLAGTSQNDIEELKSERIALKNRIEKKTAYLGDLEDQRVGVQNLIKRNEQLYSSGNTPSGGVALPFILIQTRPHATVEMEISEDMQLVHFDFNSTPFRLHDDNYVLKAMNLGNGPNTVCTEGGAGSKMFQPRVPLPPRPTAPHGRPPPSPPLPGSVKYEH